MQFTGGSYFVNVIRSVVSLVALTSLLFFEPQKGCNSQLRTALTKMQNGKRNTSLGGIQTDHLRNAMCERISIIQGQATLPKYPSL